MLAKMEGEVLYPEHIKNPLEDGNTAAAGQSAQLTHPATQSVKPTPESAKPIATLAAALEEPESAKPTVAAPTALEPRIGQADFRVG
jgi:hypothetical protein